MNKMLDKWLESYNKLEEKHDRLWEKYTRYQQSGDKTRERRTFERMEYIESYQEGMIEALNIFGYCLQYQDGQYVVVEL